jgi:hypothetical protein
MFMFGYIDPGTGALIWQSIVGTCVGVVFFFKSIRKRVVGLFARLFRRGPKKMEQAPCAGDK